MDYIALLRKDADSDFSVDFPDFPGCVTAGTSLEEARLLAAEREKQSAAQAQTRKLLVGSGDRSQRIRTYNFPQGRVTDHRIDLTLYKLDQVMQGDIDTLVEALQGEEQAELLASLA